MTDYLGRSILTKAVVGVEKTVGRRTINLKNWQDYRGRGEGVLVYHNTASEHELALRDVLNEHGKGYQSEPNY